MNAAGAPLLGVAPGAVTLTAQVTCLLLLALALAWLGRRGSPRTLHLLWTTTFALVLALPLLGSLGPSWEVPLLPAAAAEPPPAASPAFDDPPIEDAGAAPSSDAAEMREALVRAAQARLDAQSDAARGASADAPPRHASVRIAWIIWIVGCGLSLVSLAFGALRLRRLVRTARPLRDPEWVRQAEALRRRLGLRAEVRLLSSAAVATPLTGGLRSPVILLPESASSWSDERRAVVLSHELVHVRRHDALRKIMRRAACALYWFHPLVWATERLAALAGEKACDEEVVALGVRPSEYARHLLFLAATGPSRDSRAPALALVHTSQLERRIVSILARVRPRPSPVRTALTLTVIGVVGALVAAARPVPIDSGDAGAAAASPDAAHAEAPTEAAARAAMVAEARRRTATPTALDDLECLSASNDSIRSFSLRADGSMVPKWKWTDGGFTIVRPVADMLLCMRAEGDVGLNAEGTAVQTLGEDSWLVVESRGERTHRLAVARGPGGIEREWSVDGVRQPLDAEAGRWRELMFTVMHAYSEAWLSYAGALVLYGRISGYRGELSKLISAMRAGELPQARDELQHDLAGWEAGISRVTRTIRRSGLDDELGAVARQLAEYDLAAALLETEPEASELDDILREIEDRIQVELGSLGLEFRLVEAEHSSEEVIAELREVTR